jgi:hypothetical protein
MRSNDEARAALAAQPFPANPWVQVTDEAVLIKAGYNEAMQRMLRWVPQACWRRDLRCWWVPLSGAELVRSVLPEVSRLAEAMQEELGTAAGAEHTSQSADASQDDPHSDAPARRAFRGAARLLYGSDWQRETAHALGRDEAALACWLVGQGVAEAPAAQLLGEMLALMRRRAADIHKAADVLEARLDEPPLHP